MTVEVRLFATLREGRGKVIHALFEEPACPRDVIGSLDIAEKDVAILLINGRDGLMDTLLKEGDKVSIFPPVGGG
jgi:molybdopterin converting factor small subunit